jgi:hypothetical protein
MLQLNVGGRQETTSIQLSWLQARPGRSPQKKGTENTKEHNGKGVLFNIHQARSVLRGGSAEQRRATAAGSSTMGFCGISSLRGKRSVPAPVRQKDAGQSVPATDVNSLPLENMMRVVSVVHQIVTEINSSVSEEDKIVAITEIVLNLLKQNGH